ncbi:transmembrane protein [Anaeramoeba flamelloides]|uniref:Transmembrane protein n=1 Tax=Anaeramoeba flamelloides TaxID=1746091 RepID=A0AAV7ZB24_9EUKA|nr:transmembrane protein [Anaeramoeba flamelloides]
MALPAWFGWVSVISAVLFWGSFAAPARSVIKKHSIDPMVYQVLFNFWIMCVSWLPLLWSSFQFTWFGFYGAFLWVPCSICSMFALKFIGIGLGQSIWSAITILVSFIVGTTYLGESIRSKTPAFIGLALILVGLSGFAFIKIDDPDEQKKDNKILEQETDIEEKKPLIKKSDEEEEEEEEEDEEEEEEEEEQEEQEGQENGKLVKNNKKNHNTEFSVKSKALDYVDETTSRSNGNENVKSQSSLSSNIENDIFSEVSDSNGNTNSINTANEQEPSKKEATKSQKKKKFLNTFIGVVFATFCGLFNGLNLVPLNKMPKKYSSMNYVVSFGVGSLCVTIGCFLIYSIINFSKKRKNRFFDLGHLGKIKHAMLPSFASAILWTTASVCAVYANEILSMAIGFSLTQLCCFISTLYSIFIFKEITETKSKITFFISVVILLVGAFLLGYFGESH